jgi:hypothetical protein
MAVERSEQRTESSNSNSSADFSSVARDVWGPQQRGGGDTQVAANNGRDAGKQQGTADTSGDRRDASEALTERSQPDPQAGLTRGLNSAREKFGDDKEGFDKNFAKPLANEMKSDGKDVGAKYDKQNDQMDFHKEGSADSIRAQFSRGADGKTSTNLSVVDHQTKQTRDDVKPNDVLRQWKGQ